VQAAATILGEREAITFSTHADERGIRGKGNLSAREAYPTGEPFVRGEYFCTAS
jgi:hypothetical protein